MHVPNWGCVQLPSILLKNQGKSMRRLAPIFSALCAENIWTEAEITRYNLRMECGECISTSARTGLTSIGT